MKQLSFLAMPVRFTLFLAILLVISCTKDAETITVDTSVPQGTFSTLKQGNIVEQNSTGSKGLIQLGQDSKGILFVKFGSDFTTVLATGTVTVYLSTSNTFKADPGKGNPDLKLVGFVSKNGEMFMKLNSPVESKFTHLILWCGSANIPFGNAELK
ncbi:MAG: hypothetical protein SH818_01015 [Saprospiraceae bacterium]|nr:hypothetical protein [Saprospiraceae bacterium]